MPQYVAEIKGMKELQQIMKKFPDVAEKHMRKAMRVSVTDVEAAVVPLTPVGVSKRLRGSMASEVQGHGPNIVGLVGSTLKGEKYPAVMEFGRRPGAKMPPPRALERWVHLVLKVPAAEVKGVAYLVARAIARKGIKGKRFLEKGFKKAQPKVIRNFNKGLTDMMKEINRGR
jgi:hypothetical protein